MAKGDDMARETISPPLAGDTCSICWGAGKAFGSSPTPSVVTVVFADIEKGGLWVPGDGEPPNNSYRLTQTVPCVFRFGDIGVTVTWDLLGGITSLILNLAFTIAFFANPSTQCVTVFENQNVPGSSKFTGGHATVYI